MDIKLKKKKFLWHELGTKRKSNKQNLVRTANETKGWFENSLVFQRPEEIMSQEAPRQFWCNVAVEDQVNEESAIYYFFHQLTHYIVHLHTKSDLSTMFGFRF